MTATDLVLIVLVLAAMAAVAVTDARRAIVDPRMVLALVGAGLLWRLFGSAETGSLWTAALGAALGVVVVAVPIALAYLRRRRWPLFPGDAMLLGGLGFVLGPLGLGWALLAGALCSLLHRACLQRRRGRSFLKGYCPLGPGMAAGAMAVFVFVNVGGALAADGSEIPLPPEHPASHDVGVPTPPSAPYRDVPLSRPGDIAAATGAGDHLDTGQLSGTGELFGTPMLAASELAPVRAPLPSPLAERTITIDEREPLAFAAIAGRIATLAGVPVKVEERPARVAGGAVRLPDPPRVHLAFDGSLPGLLDLVAKRTGYDWTWIDGAVVFHRYHDVEQRSPGHEWAVRQAEGTAAGQGGDAATLWLVERDFHGTLRAVLEDWGVRAGWSVIWAARRDYAVRADAAFEGGFLDAVDSLLAAPATRRSLVAFAHEPNRHLVIEPAGALR